jgi:hypothetical protein
MRKFFAVALAVITLVLITDSAYAGWRHRRMMMQQHGQFIPPQRQFRRPMFQPRPIYRMPPRVQYMQRPQVYIFRQPQQDPGRQVALGFIAGVMQQMLRAAANQQAGQNYQYGQESEGFTPDDGPGYTPDDPECRPFQCPGENRLCTLCPPSEE